MLHGGLETVPSLHSSFDFLSFDNQTCKKTCTVRVFSRALQGSLRQALRKHCGDSWPSQLLSTFGLQRKDGVDANVLQSALRWGTLKTRWEAIASRLEAAGIARGRERAAIKEEL